LREIFAASNCALQSGATNAEISLRGPAATMTGASDNAPGDRAKEIG
jgi:hypothetical protein